MGEFVTSRVSLGQAHTAAARLLREARIAAPELDARLLLCHAAGLTHEAYVAGLNDTLAPDAAARFGAYVARRLCWRAGVAHHRDPRVLRAPVPHRFLDARPPTGYRDADRGSACAGGPRGAAEAARPRHGDGLHPDHAVGRVAAARPVSASTKACRRLSSRGPMRQALGSGIGRSSWPEIGWRPSEALSISWSPIRLISRRRTWRGSPMRSAPMTPGTRSTAALMGFPPIAVLRRASGRCFAPAGLRCSRSAIPRQRLCLSLLAEEGLILEQGPWRDLAGRPRVVGGRVRG